MALTPWRGLWESRFPSLRDEIDKMFEDFFGKTDFSSLADGTWNPPMDVQQTKKDVIVMMDIPAIDPKAISISIIEDRITIKGERKREEESQEADYYRSERVYGSFQRIIQLPAEVVGDKAKASYKDGVLKITIPKSQKVVPKEVKIEVQ
ncbi:MAG TPA: Hsp20/alpha crystallin family protein [Syntrophorhabdus sp.]|jgi:HSP20 family protein|nr:Hsp20/alpha crystallin family protein [Syntrophorhabdus sp.]MDI9557484.1 Hsp20/alpha crystallin family protein [Pseudomonadota bacterium]OPX96642.1 MAG: Spore protein SP21 [Syntrophorhabdus sp. PtaB.Bin027]OQB77242.1 MAG: Spore protein SP21 [Deltaproteobacteria bacterium ADurb.Bin135]MBP8744269.1 Hsp20/alpha crystallin family protein [Syntrophorhabdus sp.]